MTIVKVSRRSSPTRQPEDWNGAALLIWGVFMTIGLMTLGATNMAYQALRPDSSSTQYVEVPHK